MTWDFESISRRASYIKTLGFVASVNVMTVRGFMKCSDCAVSP